MIHSFRKFFEFAGRQSRNWYLGLLYEIIRCILEALQFAALLVVLDGLVHDNITAQTALLAFGIMLVSVIGTAIFWYLAHGKEGEGSYRMCEDKRIQIGNRMKYMPMGYFNSHSLGNLTSVSTATMSDLESMSFAVIVRTLVGVIHASIFSVAMSYFSWKISLIFLTGVILFMVINTMLLRCSKRLSPIRLNAQTEFMDAVLEYIQGMSVVRAFHMAKQSNTTLEKSSNLDIKSIRELKDVLRKWKAQGKTIVIAEHRLYYLMDIADRVLYMQGGQIKENLSISDFKKKSTGELHALGLRTLQSEDFSKMQSTVCATKQLYIRDFEVSYKNASGGKKKRKVLDISDLMIPQGSVVGVVGNNGAGKTTFANNLCGLLKTAKGCMSMNGKTYMANQRIKTCYMVMQDVNHQLFTESVMDEILLSLDNSDEDKAMLEAEKIMESLHISEFRNAHPMSLSGGQKQRVAIASAIASDKQVIVFDEPTSGLDYRHMKKVAENLRELSSLGKTLFIVTHDPELIAECCNYFVFIEDGKVLWSDGWNRISRERLQRFFAFEGD